MKDESPNGLVMSPEPVVARMGRWPLYALLIVLILLLAALIYSVNFAHDPQKKEGPQKAATVGEEDKPVWLVEGSGLALDPKKDRTSGVMVPPEPAKPEPIVVVQREAKPDQQIENIRRVRAQCSDCSSGRQAGIQRRKHRSHGINGSGHSLHHGIGCRFFCGVCRCGWLLQPCR